MIVRCPKCPLEMRIEQEVPDLPAGLGVFDCPMCFQAFVLWKHSDGDIRVAAVTRTGTTRAQA